jgi:hypothetical protein
VDINTIDILKWIGIALAAGFIGYFGRYLAMLIIDRVRGKEHETVSAERPAGLETVNANGIEQSRLKIEKKKAKQAVKKIKKSGKK